MLPCIGIVLIKKLIASVRLNSGKPIQCNGKIGSCCQSSIYKPLTFQRETDFHIGFICTIAFLLESKCFPSGDLKYDLCSPHFFIFHPLSGGRNGSLIQALLGGDFKLCCLIYSTASVWISLY